MIRSSKVTLKFTNCGKLCKLEEFRNEYHRVLVILIDAIWDLEKLPTLLPKSVTSKVPTWLSARAVQCVGKQASGIVRGVKKKQTQRLYIINKLTKEGSLHQARKLRNIYNKTKVSKPVVNNIACELDERFTSIAINENATTFDGWLTLASLGKKLKVRIPLTLHKHFNQLLTTGQLKKGVRLGKDYVTFMFDLVDPVVRTTGNILGIDIGQTTTLSCSNGQQLTKCPHGHDYLSINRKLAKKQKGSKSFNRTVNHRRNYLQYIVKRLNLTGVRIVNRENIKHLRKFTNTSRELKHWNYAELFEVLDNHLTKQGVLVNKVNPTYTSQRCSACGWTQKLNRKGKQFKCKACSHEQDADLNASLNLSFTLSKLTVTRSQHSNIKGFYWKVVGKESIVPCVQ